MHQLPKQNNLESKNVLTAKEVSVSLFGTKIIENISVDLSVGQVLAIVGPNGAGKTTFMKALLGLLPHTGSVLWAPSVRIGYVPQKVFISRAFPLTVEELFLLRRGTRAFWFRTGKATEHTKKWLSRVGAENLFKKQLAVLSGGELQRVMIAYALADDANVLCLDEPAAGIDIGGGQTIYSLLKDLSLQEQRTIILISHELDIVFRYADEVVCIDKRMICRGSPHVVLTAENIERMYGSHTALYAHDGETHTHQHV